MKLQTHKMQTNGINVTGWVMFCWHQIAHNMDVASSGAGSAELCTHDTGCLMVTRIPASVPVGVPAEPLLPFVWYEPHLPPLATFSQLHRDHSVRPAHCQGPREPGIHAAKHGFEVILSRSLRMCP